VLHPEFYFSFLDDFFNKIFSFPRFNSSLNFPCCI